MQYGTSQLSLSEVKSWKFLERFFSNTTSCYCDHWAIVYAWPLNNKINSSSLVYRHRLSVTTWNSRQLLHVYICRFQFKAFESFQIDWLRIALAQWLQQTDKTRFLFLLSLRAAIRNIFFWNSSRDVTTSKFSPHFFLFSVRFQLTAVIERSCERFAYHSNYVFVKQSQQRSGREDRSHG